MSQRPNPQPNYFLSSSDFLLLKVSLINLLINLHSTGPVGHSNLTNLFWQLSNLNDGHISDILSYNITRSADISEQFVTACSSSSTGPRPGLPLATLGPGGPQNLQPLLARGTGGWQYLSLSTPKLWAEILSLVRSVSHRYQERLNSKKSLTHVVCSELIVILSIRAWFWQVNLL